MKPFIWFINAFHFHEAVLKVGMKNKIPKIYVMWRGLYVYVWGFDFGHVKRGYEGEKERKNNYRLKTENKFLKLTT